MGRDAVAVEAWVKYVVMHWWQPNGAIDQALDREAAAHRSAAESNLVSEQAADRMTRQYYADRVADRAYDEVFPDEAALRRQIRRLDDKIAKRAEQIERTLTTTAADKIQQRGEQLRARWESEGLDFQRRVLRACVDRVVIHPTSVGNYPFNPAAVEVVPGGVLDALSEGDPTLTPPPQQGEPPRRQGKSVRKVRDWLADNPGVVFDARMLVKLGLTLPSARGIVNNMRRDGEIVEVAPYPQRLGRHYAATFRAI